MVEQLHLDPLAVGAGHQHRRIRIARAAVFDQYLEGLHQAELVAFDGSRRAQPGRQLRLDHAAGDRADRQVEHGRPVRRASFRRAGAAVACAPRSSISSIIRASRRDCRSMMYEQFLLALRVQLLTFAS
jgi:hypothetical protein